MMLNIETSHPSEKTVASGSGRHGLRVNGSMDSFDLFNTDYNQGVLPTTDLHGFAGEDEVGGTNDASGVSSVPVQWQRGSAAGSRTRTRPGARGSTSANVRGILRAPNILPSVM